MLTAVTANGWQSAVVGLWRALWDDFETRGRRLSNGGIPADHVDETILWQMHGHAQFVGTNQGVASYSALHLPELYSGCPWRSGTDGTPGKKRTAWIACMAINPGIDMACEYPTLSHRSATNGHLASIDFEGRFRDPAAEHPPRTGRDRLGRARVYMTNGTDRGQPTWSRLEAQLDRALRVRNSLGTRAAIFDMVPWKFNNWSAIGQPMKQQFIQDAAQQHSYVHRSLRLLQPQIVLIMGGATFDFAQTAWHVPNAATPVADLGTVTLPGGGCTFEAIKTPHPVASQHWHGFEALLRRKLGIT